MDEPLAELSAYFRSKSRVPGPELVRLTAAARVGGSRWVAIAAACGVQTSKDLAGVLYRISGETGAELLYSATQYAVEQLTGGQRRCPPLTWYARIAGSWYTTAPRTADRSTSSTATRRAARGWPGTRPPTTRSAASRSPA